MTAAPLPTGFDIPAWPLSRALHARSRQESIEILVAEAAPLLRALRLDDDEMIVAQFRRVDLAFRTAKQCAVEIRDMGIGGGR